MRPKLLEIEGLQSFRDVQKIDFEALSETGLFGIFGPTGSGKSTVLDAITFALYGKVKRAEGGTQGIINTNQKLAKVSFDFELVKDGRRRNYRVERVYQRKKGSLNSSEAKIARLIEVTNAGEIPLCDKANEVSNTIKELLGLSHEDFTRAVVLPQNSFQEFLLLNNSDRRGMLERIFYLEEYGKQLTEKLGRKMGRLKSRLDILSGELKGYEDASDEAIQEAQKAKDEAATERDNALKELKVLEVRFNEAKEVWNLVQDLSLVMEKQQQQLSSQEIMVEKRARLDKAQKAEGLLELIQKVKELDEKLKETKIELEDILIHLPIAKTGLNETKTMVEALKNEINLEQPRLVGLKARLEDALGIKAEIAALINQINALNKRTEQISNAIASKTQLLKKVTEEHNNLEQDHAKLKAEADAIKISPEYRQQIQEGIKLEREGESQNGNVKNLEKNVSTLKGTINNLIQKHRGVQGEIAVAQKALDDLNTEKQKHSASMPENKGELQKKTEKLHVLQAAYEILCFRKNELDSLGNKKVKQQDELKAHALKAISLLEIKTKANTYFEICKLEVDNAIKEMEQNAAHRLSQALKEGEPCPVCGSEHHPKPIDHAEGSDLSVLEQRIEEAKEKLAQAEKALKEADKVDFMIDEKVKSLTEQNKQILGEYEQKIHEYSAEKSKLPESLKNLELYPMRQELERMNHISIEKLKAIETWEKEQDAFKEKLQKLNETLNGLLLSDNGVATELKVNGDSLSQLEKSLEEAKNMASQAQQKYSEFLQNYPIQSATAEVKRLSEIDHHLHDLQGTAEKVQEAIRQKWALLEKSKEELRLLSAEYIKHEAELKSFSFQKDAKVIKLKELAGEALIEDEIKGIDEKLMEYARLEKSYLENLQRLEKQVNNLENKKAILINQQTIFYKSFTKEENNLNVALKEKGFPDKNEVVSALLPQDKQKALKNEIESYDQNGVNIQAQKTMIQKKLDSRDITMEEWNQLSSSYQEIAAFKEQCVSRSEVAKNNFENIKNKHDKWAEINKTYRELIHKQGMFEQIQKVLKAELRKDNSFIDYIAEERLRYVAAKASETLGVMTKYKYGLELDTETGFNIRDNANGGICRRVTSLSGGETFLTALSLALALSEQIQLKGQSPLEFFFLDEGFGTLDNTLLDTVIDALERLSKKERVIGLISHVPELRSRIGRRLILDPPASQGEGSRVRIEKA